MISLLLVTMGMEQMVQNKRQMKMRALNAMKLRR
jgi:hypothetical protein